MNDLELVDLFLKEMKEKKVHKCEDLEGWKDLTPMIKSKVKTENLLRHCNQLRVTYANKYLRHAKGDDLIVTPARISRYFGITLDSAEKICDNCLEMQQNEMEKEMEMTNEKLSLMNIFNIAVKDSVQSNKNLKNIGNHKYYYSKVYDEKIQKYLKEKGVESLESEKGSLRSTSSSARLCTNYFYDENVEFEKPLKNDIFSTTKMDAVAGNIYYECKCQEIVNGEHEYLRQSYENKPSKLFKEFGVKNIYMSSHFKKDGTEDYKYCEFDLKDIGINLDGKYYEINFNVKQLICHLIAIANNTNDNEEKILRYIIFVPKAEIIDQNSLLKDLYQTLDSQFKAILNSPNIKGFIARHNIKIEMKLVYIDDVKEHFND